MARVITLDGLRSGKLGRTFRKCKRKRVVYSPTLGEDIEVCDYGRENPKRTRSHKRSEVKNMAKARRKARKSGSMAGMRKGSCKIVKKRCICRAKTGHVTFAKKGRCKR